MVDEKNVKRGKKSKAQGAIFELRVRSDLEEKGWTVDKWTNNVEPGHVEGVGGLKIEDIEVKKWVHPKLIRAKNKWAGPGRPISQGAGFPDFVVFRPSNFERFGCSECRRVINVNKELGQIYEVIGVESKIGGELSKIEKEKCKWMLDNNIFSKILIAEKTKVKNKVVIVYHDFKEKYWRFYENSKD